MNLCRIIEFFAALYHQNIKANVLQLKKFQWDDINE